MRTIIFNARLLSNCSKNDLMERLTVFLDSISYVQMSKRIIATLCEVLREKREMLDELVLDSADYHLWKCFFSIEILLNSEKIVMPADIKFPIKDQSLLQLFRETLLQPWQKDFKKLKKGELMNFKLIVANVKDFIEFKLDGFARMAGISFLWNDILIPLINDCFMELKRCVEQWKMSGDFNDLFSLLNSFFTLIRPLNADQFVQDEWIRMQFQLTEKSTQLCYEKTLLKWLSVQKEEIIGHVDRCISADQSWEPVDKEVNCSTSAFDLVAITVAINEFFDSQVHNLMKFRLSMKK